MISRPEQKSFKTEWYLFSRDKILTKGQEASASAYIWKQIQLKIGMPKIQK